MGTVICISRALTEDSFNEYCDVEDPAPYAQASSAFVAIFSPGGSGARLTICQ
jgi:hypothetical protein